MSLLEALILGILQGAAEFLPISSSGHLVLVPWWLGWDSPPLIYDVTVHVGTATAILIYFWREWLALARAGIDLLRTRRIATDEQRLLIMLMIGTIPAVIAGLLLEDYFDAVFSEPALVAFMLLVTAGLLIFSEWYSHADQTIAQMTFTDGLLIGVAQALAIIPGISRSGSTIAAGMTRHLHRAEAARYSFLLATPIIIGAGAKQALDLLTGDVVLTSDMVGVLGVGFLAALVTGYLSISFLLRLVRQQTLYIFAFYCAVFGTVSLIAALSQ